MYSTITITNNKDKQGKCQFWTNTVFKYYYIPIHLWVWSFSHWSLSWWLRSS